MSPVAPLLGRGDDAPPLALTMGDPAGVGGEICLKAWASKNSSPFFVIDDVERLRQLSETLSMDVSIFEIREPTEAIEIFSESLPVLHRPLKTTPVAGKPSVENADAIIQSIQTAVELTQAGLASAVVTNPIHKKSLYDSGFKFPGHTEYLAELAGIDTPPVMMLASPELRVVPVTIHVSVAEALATLSQDDIVTMATITAKSLLMDFGLASPRLAIAGLNPHAGEGGGMGDEESTIITPAIRRLQAQGIDATGPWPPDTLFHAAARKNYDAAICMYHDQALIPIKTIDFDGAVNVTLGLPFVRTSPDHGTAFDIAGTGKASERSLLSALNMAAEMADRRRG